MDNLQIWLWKQSKKILVWGLWLLLLVVSGLYFYNTLTGEDKSHFIPGKTSAGHYQIEVECQQCHNKTFDVIKQESCLACHKEKKRRDSKSNSHRAKLFEAEDKAEDIKKIPADRCVSCHTEHQIGRAGVTQPADFCIHCHQDIEDDRPSHKDLPFDECSSCHNYHDNSVNYYQPFIRKHLKPELETLNNSFVLQRNFAARYLKKHRPKELTKDDQNAPVTVDSSKADDWLASSHAKAGVNCNACHQNKKKVWLDQPPPELCKSCHKQELKGFLGGKHGMRLKQKLSPMNTAMARLEMTSHDKELNCVSCHQAHNFDTNIAAVEACLSCHNDQHSLAYKNSPHFQLWQLQDNEAPQQGISCAGCHLPRHKKGKKVLVQHNQNHNLRPSQKMAKDTCINCHSLTFSIDALADQQLINNNFSTTPHSHITIMEMWADYFINSKGVK